MGSTALRAGEQSSPRKKNGPMVHISDNGESSANYSTECIAPVRMKNGPMVHFSEKKEDDTMLKIRLMGTKRDIKWFRRILEREKNIQILEFSDLYTNKGTDRFYRCYVEVDRPEKEKRELLRNSTAQGTDR